MPYIPTFHPGEILVEEYLKPLDFSPYALAKALGVPRTWIERLCAGKTPVTVDTAVRLAIFFGTTPNFWLNMQTSHDLAHAEIDVSGIARYSDNPVLRTKRKPMSKCA